MIVKEFEAKAAVNIKIDLPPKVQSAAHAPIVAIKVISGRKSIPHTGDQLDRSLGHGTGRKK